MKDSFLVDSADAILLLAYEKASNLQGVAEALGRNPSVISRRLSRIAKTGLIEKRENRWVFTERGKNLNRWTKSAIRDQALALQESGELRVGAPREFSARILVPETAEWHVLPSRLRFVTTDQGVEDLLLARKIDLAFDCGAPYSPEVAFKRVARETFGAYFGSARALKSHGTKTERASLRYLHYERFDFAEVRRESGWIREPHTVFSDIASIRAALIRDPSAWTILPDYCMETEAGPKTGIVRANFEPLPPLHFGIWWLRSQPPADAVLRAALAWLRKQESRLDGPSKTGVPPLSRRD